MTTSPVITADAVAELIRHDQVVVVDCRFSLADPSAGEAQYAAGHLPGAVYAHLDKHLSSIINDTSGRHPLPDAETFARQLGEWGIGNQTQVVAYDAAGGPFAARFWWLCRWVGMSKVAVLDGGLPAWQTAGFELTTDVPAPDPQTFSCAKKDALWISADELERRLAAGEVTLVDVRAPERYRGEVEPIDPVAGHVPGAINLPFTQHHESTGELLPPDALRRQFAPLDHQSDASPVVFMCGSGVTACVGILAWEAAGMDKECLLFPGSWSEWIRSAGRPVATGPA